ncbi:baseplate J/gp47 family protein [Paenibacillus sp. FSL R7-0204]|uniref:baseplate J/gp47 family protein n=1 Tax=Paenibacillus sp. FSL R7-0204 TaxID=2921675 RepID=UPI0030F653FE
MDNLTGDLLTNYVKQRRGIIRNAATYALGIVPVTGAGTINIGDLFETANGIQFKTIQTKVISGTGSVNVQCMTLGDIGNVPANQITQIPVTLSGITAVTNPLATHDGYEAESDDALRERYYTSVRTPATSGNVYHYFSWAKEISGVGDVKVFPMDTDIVGGISEVDVVIINQLKEPASERLINEVQEYIDPVSEGLGYGQAPIGAKCYVSSADALTPDISMSVVHSSEYTEDQIIENITESITSYLRSVAFKTTYISEARIGSAILDSNGVQDYSNLYINGVSGNITVDDREVAVIGVVTIV